MPGGHLAGFQVIEVFPRVSVGRVAWDAIGALFIVSGAFGLFRRESSRRSAATGSHRVGRGSSS